LSLSHNSIVHLPGSIGKLRVLNILHLGFNPISDQAEFFRLTRNLNLSTLDLEGSSVSCEAKSLLMAVRFCGNRRSSIARSSPPTTKFNQCQIKLSALEDSTVSAERYHPIMRAQQKLSQKAMSAAKSQKVALDSMQHEISVLSKRNASLRHSYKEPEQSHKVAQVEHESQIKELRQQIDVKKPVNHHP
jgi:predicted  nucleic acid-binding Zn-ribbon protein